jgi:8-oxo-dGTP pyrophosphatase MutT (NUDIX family)
MIPHRIRPLAICVFRHQERILAVIGYDRVKHETFYRPLGGGIEFGEHSADTLVREVREELGAEVSNLRFLGSLENIFTFNGRRGHEIVQVYDGTFTDPALYEQPRLDVIEDNGMRFTAEWKPLVFFQDGGAPLYPDGLLNLLEQDKLINS